MSVDQSSTWRGRGGRHRPFCSHLEALSGLAFEGFSIGKPLGIEKDQKTGGKLLFCLGKSCLPCFLYLFIFEFFLSTFTGLDEATKSFDENKTRTWKEEMQEANSSYHEYYISENQHHPKTKKKHCPPVSDLSNTKKKKKRTQIPGTGEVKPTARACDPRVGGQVGARHLKFLLGEECTSLAAKKNSKL